MRYDDIEKSILLDVAQKVDWFSTLSGENTTLSTLKKQADVLAGKHKDAVTKVERHSQFMEQATDTVFKLAMQKYNYALAQQAQLETEIDKLNTEIATHTHPDASIVNAKLGCALDALQSETGERKRYELRATINAVLRDQITVYCGIINSKQAYYYKLNSSGEIRLPTISSDDHKLTNTIADLKSGEAVTQYLIEKRDAVMSNIEDTKALIAECEKKYGAD